MSAGETGNLGGCRRCSACALQKIEGAAGSAMARDRRRDTCVCVFVIVFVIFFLCVQPRSRQATEHVMCHRR
ncbi:hypothetical protein V5799_018377 [Amblyomma americanum]|uniref:Uncharacterized protein n=1 Tax=Amblyomma americanum TaxID=6943 RepID=A0AAQ4EZL2_AMBAM